MIYITVPQSPMYHQMSVEEFLFDNFAGPAVINANMANTRTYAVDSLSYRFANGLDINALIGKLHDFNVSVNHLRMGDRHDLYRRFPIPKRSGGLRWINAPNDELMEALRRLKMIFEIDFRALYHTSAFAYVKNRCTVDAVKKHQQNGSKWFAKMDLHDFFGSTTMKFVLDMFSTIYPFSEVLKTKEGQYELAAALGLAFLDGGLPQGTSISPLITNIMMIPIDYKLANTLREFEKQRYVYTRYADDFIISSKYDFDIRKLQDLVVKTLAEFNAPFSLNAKKTRYGSSSGSNWNLGVVLNKDNQITVGYKRKRLLQNMAHNYIRDKKNGVSWPAEDIMAMQGNISYCRMVEKQAIDAIIHHINQKEQVDLMRLIKEDLR